MRRPQKLGPTQEKVLLAMRAHGGFWHAGCSWMWNTLSGTALIMDSLVDRGLVTKTIEPTRTVYRLIEQMELPNA